MIQVTIDKETNEIVETITEVSEIRYNKDQLESLITQKTFNLNVIKKEIDELNEKLLLLT